MTKFIQMVAAGIGCLTTLSSLSALAQTNQFLALNASSSTTEFLLSAKPNLVEAVHFCGENLPTNQPTITAHWSRTLSRQAALASTLSLLKRRASVVFPLIEPILKQYGIPSDFKFLPLLESAVTNRAVSRKGAAGFWQLMPQTAQSLGLNVSRRHDERFNLQKATHAACQYLNELYDQLGSWMLVATAYNAGPNYIQQLSRRYPDVHPMALPYRAAETKAYLFQAIAIKELLTRPQAYPSHLSNHHIAALSDSEMSVSAAERAAILASFDMDETDFPEAIEKGEPTFIADSTTTVVLLTEDETPTESPEPTESPVANVAGSSSSVTVVAPNRLITRSLSDGPLAEGKFFMFQVVQPVTINERTFAVGDVIHAYVELIDPVSKRAFLRTDRLISAQTQETIPLKLVATEQPKQPGAALPTQVNGWQLGWEQL
ncbi:lytic transglycosylase domain-containing protein [Spirosoma oryzicola]|uniref:lytic transglycosylase domain-containing protein n=1 Tax=Spirosoma oryzicola TaxID=2898794 RepID=UPI001E48561B|nr:lytic transglycosylase domain-containing protein [Spirosoma oryzicola]UHG91920.1 lytic transglycosylase domain-containing protein [Spirosoma oryzicola]